jgi:hypothetical protein
MLDQALTENPPMPPVRPGCATASSFNTCPRQT